MAEIPESLLRRSAEAKAKALGVPVEDVLAEMKGGPPVVVPRDEPADVPDLDVVLEDEPAPVEEIPPAGDDPEQESPDVESDPDQDVQPEEPKEAEYADEPDPDPVPDVEPADEPAAATESDSAPEPTTEDGETETVEPAAAVAVAEKPVEEPPAQSSNGSTNGSGNGKVASMVSPRPSVPPAGTPEGVRTQRLLTVVKARAIQNVKSEPTDKVNTWPHLMLMEFGALLAITALLVIMSIIIHSPLLDPANFNATPNPSKAPWYFLGLQELLSYFDPQIAGVMIPTFTGFAFFILVPYLDKNPSTTPSDRKFAIALYSMFLAGAATLTIIGVLFRGQGFNFSYPWRDGVFFDDLKDWVHFE
jgi:menaquinol-cytochrome c reductase cytochrome b/c subunit